MTTRIMKRACGWLAGAALAAGCGSQATPDYPGEKLSVIQGLVLNERGGDAPGDALVVVSWGVGMFGFGESVAEVEGEFPAQFALSLYEPPPGDVLHNPAEPWSFPDYGYPFALEAEATIAIGRILAVGKDANGDPDPHQVLGGAEGHLLLYAETDIEEGTLTAEMIASSAPAGYHLVKVHAPNPAVDDPIVECQAGSQSLDEWHACGFVSNWSLAPNDDEVAVRLAPDHELELPYFLPRLLPPNTDLSGGPVCGMNDPMCP